MGDPLHVRREYRRSSTSSRSVLLGLVLLVSGMVMGQGSENFTNLPTASSTSYLNRTWTGTDAVIWTAEGARTDQSLTGTAICFGNSPINRWVTSPVYAGGMGTLSFNYVRGFTGTGGRTIQVWVNGVQIGGNIAVSTTSNTPVLYSQAINVAGNVQLEIRSTGASQVIVDDINWTAFTAGPTVSFNSSTNSAGEAAGSVVINLPISPAVGAGGGTVTVSMANGAGCTYGAGNDYTTTPAGPAPMVLTVAAFATSVTFMLNINDDIITEFNETITFTITGTTGGIFIGTPASQVFTIIDNDVTPTVNFSTLSITVMETAGLQNFSLSINPAAATAGTITIQVTDGPGVTYGSGQDYLSNPGIFGGFMTIPFAAGATTAGFTITVLNDVLVELTETVNFTITGVSVGMAIGGNTGSLLTIGDDDSPPTVLGPGDLAIVGVNANDGLCSGGSGYDLVSFFCFKPIVPGTQIIITDNGYERCNAGQWGNSEGTVRMQRTGIAIPAGQVITFRIQNVAGPTNVTSFAPDGAWTCTNINNPVGASLGAAVALNNGGDQLFFMQGGTWNSGTAPANNHQHDATYTGTILYAFSSNPSPSWTASCTTNATQRSNLPPGVQCFSMAPTSASDWGKYDGVITAASQRDWIIRIENTAAWTAYLNCADYISMGNSWVSAPILPIIVAPFVPGRWRGSTSTDWFQCKNWDDVQVPVAATNVTMDPMAGFSFRNCLVNQASPLNLVGGPAVCASVAMTASTATSLNLTIDVNSTLNIGGDLTVSRTAANLPLFVAMNAGSFLNAVNLDLNSVTPGEARFRNLFSTSLATFSGNVNIGSGGGVDLQAGPPGGRMRVGGNWTNLANEGEFLDQYGTVEFNGAGAQSINTSGFREFFGNLTVNKSGGSLTLNNPVAIRGVLNLTNGRVNTSNPAGLLTMLAGSSSINATDASFVNGPMEKVGNTPYTFPVGKGTKMRPAGLLNVGGAIWEAFRAEYFPISGWSFGIAREATIDHVSDCEHWLIDRSIGASTATIVLTWEAPYSCGVTNLSELLVARWDDAAIPAPGIWRDRGNGGAAGTFAAGSIPTAVSQTLFNASGTTPWTLASTTSNNPLPITLVQFTAQPENGDVRLNWTTASEFNNAYFSIERSRDGYSFERVTDVPGALNSNVALHYSHLDREPYPGLSYYRLRQTDVDGASTLSQMVAVMMGALNERPLLVFGNADVLTAVHGFTAGSRYTLLDMTGRTIVEGSTTMDGRTELFGLDLSRGAYLFRITNGDKMESTRFVY